MINIPPTVPDVYTSELVVISNDTSARVGNSALLACVGFGVPSVEITWSLNGISIMNSSIVTISEEEFTRGEMVFKQSFLELCNLSISDSGVYTCSVSNGLTMVNETTQLSVAGNCHNFAQLYDQAMQAPVGCSCHGQPYSCL